MLLHRFVFDLHQNIKDFEDTNHEDIVDLINTDIWVKKGEQSRQERGNTKDAEMRTMRGAKYI